LLFKELLSPGIKYLNNGGANKVVAIITTTIAVKYSGNKRDSCKPVAAIIRATSPRETIPAPIIKEERLLKTDIFAPIASPTSFVIIAIITSATINPIWLPTPLNETFKPMLTKKTGTNWHML